MAVMAASLTLTASISLRITVTSAASTSFRSGQYAITLRTPSLLAERARRFSTLEICALNSNDFRNGTNIVIDGAPWRVQEFLHVKPGKGAAFVRTKLRNYITGNTVEKTFRAREPAEEASITKDAKQYTYMDADQYVFMDMTSFDETRMSASDLGDKTKWLKENMECQVLCWNDKVIDVELPITVIVKVVQTDPGLKGDTAQGGSKPATTETGAVVSVPLFVNQGDSIQVDTRTSQYMNRVGAF